MSSQPIVMQKLDMSSTNQAERNKTGFSFTMEFYHTSEKQELN